MAAHAPKRARGRLQKLARLEEDTGTATSSTSSELLFDSEQARDLVTQWCWGEISAPGLQRAAALAYNDQKTLLRQVRCSVDMAQSSLRILASLGTHGRHEQNIKPELLRLLGAHVLSEPYVSPVPMALAKPGKDVEIGQVPFPIFLPHETFASYYSKPAKFSRLFFGGGTVECLAAFWGEVKARKDPRLENLGTLSEPQWEQKTIPLMLHGDAVPCLKIGKAGGKSFDVYSMQGVMSEGATRDKNIYIRLVRVFESQWRFW